ncbi:MAG: MBL fold metallo-hydrolase, partial [Terriglobales bacterium]
ALLQITFPVGPLACNCTLLGDETTATAIVIDPGAEVDEVLRRLAEQRWRLDAILVTHAHIDHIGGAAELKRRTGAPVWLNSRDQELYDALDAQAAWLGIAAPERTRMDAELKSSSRIALAATRLEVLETPGHTQGSVSLYLPSEGKLFAGDTLFAGSIGRTDLPGGDYATLQRSLRGTVLALPDATVVIPGHGPETTIGTERALNPFLR